MIGLGFMFIEISITSVSLFREHQSADSPLASSASFFAGIGG
jgi:hypothetical protein